MLPVDLHCHSNYSDAMPSVEQIEAHCRRRRIGIALTDHNEIRGSVRLLQKGRIPVIPGVEVGTREGMDILVYFPDAADLEDFFIRHLEPHLFRRFMVRSGIGTEKMLEAAAGYRSFISLAHPYASGRKSIQYPKHTGSMKRAVLERIHAVEVFNGGVSAEKNRMALELSKRYGKKITAGSDAHSACHMGSVHVKMDLAENAPPGDLFRALEGNRFMGLSAGIHKRTRLTTLKHIEFFVAGRSRYPFS